MTKFFEDKLYKPCKDCLYYNIYNHNNDKYPCDVCTRRETRPKDKDMFVKGFEDEEKHRKCITEREGKFDY